MIYHLLLFYNILMLQVVSPELQHFSGISFAAQKFGIFNHFFRALLFIIL